MDSLEEKLQDIRWVGRLETRARDLESTVDHLMKTLKKVKKGRALLLRRLEKEVGMREDAESQIKLMKAFAKACSPGCSLCKEEVENA